MAALVIIVGLVVLVWLLARAGIFRAFGRSAPRHTVDTDRRSIGDLPDLPAAGDFRPVFRYEFLAPLRALDDVAEGDDVSGLDALAGCARGTFNGRSVWVYSRATPSGTVVCSVSELNADVPRLEITPTSGPTDGPALPLERGTAFTCGASDDFTNAFAVTTTDDTFAAVLLDDPMRRFLLAQVEPWSFGFGGNYVVVRARGLDTVGVERFLDVATRMRDTVPSGVRRMYPASSPDAS